MRYEDAFAQHHASIARLASKMVGQHADDVCQQVWLAAWENWEQWTAHPNIAALLHKLAKGYAVRQVRKDNVALRGQAELQAVYAAEQSAETQFLRKHDLNAAIQAMETLSPSVQQAVHLSASGMSNAEIAEQTGCSDQAVRTRLSRGRSVLRPS